MKWMLALVAMVLAVVSCSQKKEAPKSKVLVLYYSQTSNTKTVAQEIANKLGADIEEIVAVNPYDGDFEATINRCMQEREKGTKPEIKPIAANLDDYDTIFIGYPVWFGTFAPPMAAFLHDMEALAVQNRTFALAQNGTWAPVTGKLMSEKLSQLKNVTVLENILTIKSALHSKDAEALNSFTDAIVNA